MSDEVWLVERVTPIDAPPFLHWVGRERSPLQARFVTDWPPGDEDVDFMHERVRLDPVVLEEPTVAERLALEGFEDAEVRPLAAAEHEHLGAWRPFALVDRLLAASDAVTLHGARCDAVLVARALVAMQRIDAHLPQLLVLDGPAPAKMMAAVRRDEDRWRVDVGPWPREGQSLQTWLAGHNVRFTAAREDPHPTDITLSGIREREDAERLVLALQSLDAASDALTEEASRTFQIELECSLIGPLRVRTLGHDVVQTRAAFRQAFSEARAPRA